MKKTYAVSSLLALFFLSFFACDGTATDDEEIVRIPFENSNLQVKVQVQTDSGLVAGSGAVILLYGAEHERNQEYNNQYRAVVDDTGVYQFSALAQSAYWITISYQDSVQLFNENTPYDTPGHPIVNSFLDVIF